MAAFPAAGGAAAARAFDNSIRAAHIKWARRPGGRSLLWRGEESPGSTEVRCRVTPGGGDPRESATESTPPRPFRKTRRAARVKGCGKSAPRRRQRRRHGKPHREQDQVGTAGSQEPGALSCRRPGRSREASGNGRPRGMVIPRGNAGTEPGLQAVWRLFFVAERTIKEQTGGCP